MLLAFETSCDETSAAVVHEGKVLANLVSSQVRLHAEYGGVVPELAAREHLRNLLPVASAALRDAGISASQLEAVAATRGPGLPNALMVGLKAAQGVGFALNKPFVGIHHHEAHLYSPWIRRAEPPSPAPRGAVVEQASCLSGVTCYGAAPVNRQDACPTTGPLKRAGVRGEDSQTNLHHENLFVADFAAFQPNVSLIVSGGHTMLVHVEAELKHRVLGSTLDDAAGECFDKTGKLMGLPYPAGPDIDRLAEGGNPAAFDFPRPMLNDANDGFSFSGLKTSVRYFLRDNPQVLHDEAKLRDLCASVQAAIVEVLVGKTLRAARRLRLPCVTASGGVTCNRALRRELASACAEAGLTLRLAERSLCTDNAAMIGVLAERKLQQGELPTELDADIEPGWALA